MRRSEHTVGKRFTSALPEWVKNNTNPSKLDVKEKYGMFKKLFETVTLYWCEKCTNKGTSGR